MEEAGISPNQLNLVGSFDAQVEHIMDSVRLKQQDVDQLRLLYKQVEETLRIRWPECKVIPFGSIVTGLGIKTSDVDCYIDTLEETCDVNDPRNVMEARNLFRRRHRTFHKIFAIPAAKVPIVKFQHVPTGINCDINFKSAAGVRNSRLLEYLLNYDRRVLKLAVLLKYWAKVHKLTGTNLMSNYCLTILVIFYLQQINFLPPVKTLQEDHVMFSVDNWNTAICRDNILSHLVSDNNLCLYDLLGGFFKFYSSIQFQENILSVYLGKILPRTAFKSLDNVPSEFDLYLHNVSSEICKPIKIDTKMCIQDPFEHNKNIAMAIHQKLFFNIINYFSSAAKIYDENKRNQFLADLLFMKVNKKKPTNDQNRELNGKVGKLPKIAKKQLKKQLQAHTNFNDLFLQYRKKTK